VHVDNDKPVFEEQALSKLLEAAYVLQEHNRGLQAVGPAQPIPERATQAPPAPQGDYAPILAKIVEIQRRIQASHLGLDDTMALVAERVVEIARASGAAIAWAESSNVRYQAVFGQMTPAGDAEIPVERALCAACLRSGQVLSCADVDLEFLLDVEECRRRGIQSMIAVPVYQSSGVAGGLEVYYDRKRGFTEQDVHTCQLMAGLVTEALTRADELTWKKSLASERSIMLEALEKLKPDLAALVDAAENKKSNLQKANAATATSAPAFHCRKCGHEMLAREQFCGQCGSPRAGGDEPPGPSNMDSLWPIQEAFKKNGTQVPTNGSSAATLDDSPCEEKLPDSFEEEMQGFGLPGLRIREVTLSTESPETAESAENDDAARPVLATPVETNDQQADRSAEDATLSGSEPVADWSSAAAARAFLEQFAGQGPGAWTRFWNDRRGDVYLAIAVILVACAIRWGIWSSHSVSATSGQPATAAAHSKPAPEDDLSLFDRMLVKLGLAEAPEAPESKGNPDVQVWVDLKTALYYCPGTDLYGKTPKGRFTTQRDAQLDQFEPAYRKTCN